MESVYHSNIYFSIIVPTYNRLEELKDLISSIENQNYNLDNLELIIVDDGSTDKTISWLSDYSSKSKLKMIVLEQEHKGQSAARNYGMEQAKGHYFIFVDSDCIADKNWLSAVYEITSKENPAGFGGPDKVLPNFSPIQKAIDYAMTSFITTGGLRGHSKKKLSKYYPRTFNMGVRNDVVEKIGGMSGLSYGEDIEFSRRMISTGEPVINIPDAVVYHKRRITIKSFLNQVFNFGKARIKLYEIDHKMLEPVHFMPSVGLIVALSVVVLSLLSPTKFLWMLIAGILILLLVGIHGIVKYKDFRVFFYIPIIIPIQILGYGFGFIYAALKKIAIKTK